MVIFDNVKKLNLNIFSAYKFLYSHLILVRGETADGTICNPSESNIKSGRCHLISEYQKSKLNNMVFLLFDTKIENTYIKFYFNNLKWKIATPKIMLTIEHILKMMVFVITHFYYISTIISRIDEMTASYT